MIPPNPRIPAARRLADELEGKRERIRLRDGKFESIGVPLTPEERAWLLVYVKASSRPAETSSAYRRKWWRK